MEFQSRSGREKKSLKIGGLIEEIPIVDQYKYLGVIINPKLTVELQLEHIKQKANFLQFKLWPVLKHVSLDYRINLWKILIKPLFELLVSHYKVECSSNQGKIVKTIRKTFKAMTLFKKGVENHAIQKFMAYDYEDRAEVVFKKSKIKWEARRNNSSPQCTPPCESPKHAKPHFPKEVQELINLTVALCPYCKVRCTASHLLNTHRIYVPDVDSIFEKCIEETNNKKKRKETIENLAKYFRPFIVAISKHLQTQNV